MLKISDIEQLNNEIFALLSTRFSYLKIAHLIKLIGIINIKEPTDALDLAGHTSTLAGQIVKTPTRYGMLLKTHK
ncbi:MULTISPECIES: hypothetical protein [unclassified Pseudoalteromonas]|uniref:hypothetical protein n=1 Tax=unclassified Pseudoalteromonas TaxID=194690 RepID=UPI000C34A96B|nr:hypothetical protein [Pseudoalteromonas sp. 78C3]PKH91874.1 hypothetical protein CXF76_09585 [Pseudoalteromonas sp. 78C3]